jgi:hypothetical protein
MRQVCWLSGDADVGLSRLQRTLDPPKQTASACAATHTKPKTGEALHARTALCSSMMVPAIP